MTFAPWSRATSRLLINAACATENRAVATLAQCFTGSSCCFRPTATTHKERLPCNGQAQPLQVRRNIEAKIRFTRKVTSLPTRPGQSRGGPNKQALPMTAQKHYRCLSSMRGAQDPLSTHVQEPTEGCTQILSTAPLPGQR